VHKWRKSNLYIGILGQRYGYVPPAAECNPAEKSITELEYEACRTPGQPPIPRLMFIKPTEAGIAAAYIDALSNKRSAPRMESFLNRAGKDQTAYVFKNLDELRSELRIRVQEKTDQFHKENERNLGTTVPGPVRVVAGPGFDLDAYQKAMRHRYSRLKPEELDPTTHDIRPLTLTGMFIAQSVRECAEFMPRVFELPKELQQRLRQAGELEGSALHEETLAQQRRAYLDQSPRPVLEVINEPALRRLVILGDPGSGKSTLLIAIPAARMGREIRPQPPAGPQQDPLPLLIELHEYARLRHEGTAASFLEYLHHGVSVRWHFNQAQLDSWMKANPSVVLFHGLDEVFDPTLRKEVIMAIHRFADEYPRARVLVTSRIIGYQYQSWRDEGFRHFMLQELDDAQIEAFLAAGTAAPTRKPALATSNANSSPAP
jgi:hypothetical protein